MPARLSLCRLSLFYSGNERCDPVALRFGCNVRPTSLPDRPPSFWLWRCPRSREFQSQPKEERECLFSLLRMSFLFQQLGRFFEISSGSDLFQSAVQLILRGGAEFDGSLEVGNGALEIGNFRFSVL